MKQRKQRASICKICSAEYLKEGIGRMRLCQQCQALTATCEICDGEMSRYTTQNPPLLRRTCSAKCKAQLINTNPDKIMKTTKTKREYIHRHCAWCKSEFDNNGTSHRVCPQCYAMRGICEECGLEFNLFAEEGRTPRKFCSTKCRTTNINNRDNVSQKKREKMKKKWESQEFVDRVLWAVSGDGAKELRERNSRRLRELWRDDQYRKEMSDRKREDWKDLTYRENILGKIIIKTWERLKSGKKTYIEIAVEQELIRLGFAPEYNHRVGNRFIDLALLDYMIGVECDGEFWHRGMEERDAKRDAYLLKHGWTIVRLTEKEIQHDVANAVSQKVLPLLSR